MNRLSPYCVTPPMRMAFFWAYFSAQLVLYPLASLLDTWIDARWTASVYSHRTQAILRAMENRTDIYPTDVHRTFFEAELSTEGLFLSERSVLFSSNVLNAAIQLVNLTANVAAGISPTALGILVGTSLLGYAVGKLFPMTMDAQTPAMRDARQLLLADGQSSWDNVVLGNRANLDRWHQGHREHANTFFVESRRAAVGQTVQGALIGLQWSLQSAFSSANAFYKQCFPSEPPFVSAAALSATQSLGSLAISFSQLSNARVQYLDIQSKLTKTTAHLDAMAIHQNLQERMKPAEISVHGGPTALTASAVIQNYELLRTPRLYTVRGNNGAGKTMMLLDCKRHFGDDALLIPASHSLNFPVERGSSGQTVKRLIRYLREHSEQYHILLLDEWDAHLDATAREELLELLRDLSATKSIVQVVHRH